MIYTCNSNQIFRGGLIQMGILKIDRKKIKKLVLFGGKKRMTAQQVLDSLTEKPDYIINAMMYDTRSGISSADCIVNNELIGGGCYCPKGIAFNTNDLTETTTGAAKGKFKYFMGGSPNLLWKGKLNIDRFNYAGVQAFSTWDINNGTAIRLGMGYTDSELIFYYTDKKTTIKHVGEHMLSLGCKAAINLDGGGSTKLCKVEKGKLVNINRPTENRPNSTWLLVYLKNSTANMPVKEETTKPVASATPNSSSNTTNSSSTKKEDKSKMAYTIMLDPGHGGVDSGAVGPTGLQEDNVNLKIANRVKSHLTRCGFNVMMTRERDDESITVSQRCSKANKSNPKACMVVSIHCNSASNSAANGIETFVYNTTLKTNAGYILADGIQKKLIAATGEINRGVKNGSHLGMLSGTAMTAVLVECGFISHPATETKMRNPEHLETIAIAIAQAICENKNVAWVEVPPPAENTEDWKTAAIKDVCNRYKLDTTQWLLLKDEPMSVGQMFGVMNKILTQLETVDEELEEKIEG